MTPDNLLTLSTFEVGTLVFARSLSVALLTPALGGVEVSKFIRVTIALLLTFLATPSVLPMVGTFPESGNTILFLILVLKEIVQGGLIGITLRIFFEGVLLAGETIARVGGISVAGSFDVNFGGELSSLSSFAFWIAFMTFICMHGLELFVDGFINTFSSTLPGGSLDFAEVANSATAACGSAFVLALKLAAPVCASTLAAYLAIGFLGRIFPQLNLMAIGFSANSLLTLVVLILGIGVWGQCFQDGATSFLESLFLTDR